MPEEIQQLNNRIKVLEDRLNGLSNDPRQVQVIKEAIGGKLPSLRVEKFGVGVAPVSTQADIAAPILGTTIDSQARTTINSILAVLDTFGLTN